MVEPEIAENTVPETMAITDSRPGTREITLSKASIAFIATPVWNSTSPISTKNGIGISEKLVTDATPLRTTCVETDLAAQEPDRADQVDAEERKAHRQAEQQQHAQRAEQQAQDQPPGHGRTGFARGPRNSWRSDSMPISAKHSGAGT